MEEEFLSKALKELILCNDRVSIPGLGSFMAEVVPSVFSDGGLVIYPPSRRISFRVSEIWNDGILEKKYSEEANISVAESKELIKKFVDKLRSHLNSKKNYIIPEFGTLRATDQNDYFFVADRELFAYIESFGLDPLNIKVLQKPGIIESIEPGLCAGMSEKEWEKSSFIDNGEILEVEYEGIGANSDNINIKEIPMARKDKNRKETVERDQAGEVESFEELENSITDTDDVKAIVEEIVEEIVEDEVKAVVEEAVEEIVEDEVKAIVEEAVENVEEPIVVKSEQSSKVLRALLIIIGIVIIIIVLLVIFKDECRPFWEWLLYSKEEREILNM